MVKKGILQEILSKAFYADDPSKYIVTYRDFEHFKQVTLLEFKSLSEDFQTIPLSRITRIEKDSIVLFKKKKDENM